MPFKNNSITALSNPDYVPVIKDTGISYGGNQMWFPSSNWYSKDYIIHNYGCGTIAIADMFLYLALQSNEMQTPETFIALRDLGKIEYDNYDSYVRIIHNEYTKTRRFLAVLGPKAANAINSYSDIYDLGLDAKWKWKLTYYDMYDMIEEMLDKDLPVILSIGPNTPNLLGKKGIPFYELREIEYQDLKEEGKENNKPYYYKTAHQNVNGHYVTVTAIVKDDVAGRIMLRISSWGKQYYINYEEYRDYVENLSGTFTSSIVYVKRYKLI